MMVVMVRFLFRYIKHPACYWMKNSQRISICWASRSHWQLCVESRGEMAVVGDNIHPQKERESKDRTKTGLFTLQRRIKAASGIGYE